MVAKRYAFTMIELIFAIVIIAISVLSLPMMIQTTSKAIESNLVQEAIFAASAELNQVTSFYWDENSLETGNSLSKIIYLDAPDPLRNGLITQPLHRKYLNNNSIRPTDASEGNNPDLNDAAHNAQSIFIGDTATSEGYKKDYKSTIKVTRPADFNGSNANIKKITVTITDSGDTVTSLNSYSANIGEVDYYKRSY